MMGKAWWQELEVAAHIFSQEAERDELNADAQLTPLFLSSLGPSYLKLGWVLLPLLTQPRLSHGSVQRFVF